MKAKKRFLIVVHNDDYTEVGLVVPSKDPEGDNDVALDLMGDLEDKFTSLTETYKYIHTNNIEVTGEYIGLIY